MEAKLKKLDENLLSYYEPTPKQLLVHGLSRDFSVGAAFGANQSGKSFVVSREIAYHLTGQYPDWWPGRKWTRPIRAIVGSKTFKLAREGIQRYLFGDGSEAGVIPKDCIIRMTRSGAVPGLIDKAQILHKPTGRISEVLIKAYDQGRQDWQAMVVDLVALDEEPKPEIFAEAQIRVMRNEGYMLLGFTPLMGMSDICMKFLGSEPSPGFGHVFMTWEDNPYLSEARKSELAASMAPHEQEARRHGRPAIGSGAILPIPDAALMVDPFEIPESWPRGRGMDFGWTHPTAVMWGALDYSSDRVYLYNEYRQAQADPAVHKAAADALPHGPLFGDMAGLQSSQFDGEELIHKYQQLGLDVRPVEDREGKEGRSYLEAGIFEILHRANTGRLKVFSTCPMWFEEKRLWHRDEKGKVVSERDDLMAASRYVIQMIHRWRPLTDQYLNQNLSPRRKDIDPRYGGGLA